MQRKKPFLKNNKNIDKSRTNSSEESSELNPTYFSLDDSTITISMDSKEETVSNDEESNTEDLDSEYIKEETTTKKKDTKNNKTHKSNYKTKKIAFIKRKRVHSLKLKTEKKGNNFHFRYPPKSSQLKKSKNYQNETTFSELDKCYNTLNDLISQYSFTEIADIIIKISNNMPVDDKTGNDRADLYKKVQKATSQIKNKENITMMCLSILSSKYSLNNQIKEKPKECKEKKEIKDKKEANNNNEIKVINKNDNIKDISEYKGDNENKLKEAKEKKNEKKKYEKIINGFRRLKQKTYFFGNHYYNDKNNIYCYRSKTNKSTRYITVYCIHRSQGCDAKCLIFANSNSVYLNGTHSQNCSLSQKEFYKDFPDLKNKNWSHIQLIKNKNEIYDLVVQK